jgi:DNA repair protein RadC
MPTNSKLNIKSWSEEDRPREKMMLKGREALSDAELLAILIGSGNTELTAVGLSQLILNSSDNNLHELGKKDLADFMAFKGIGEAKAITIAAALEMGRRRQLTDPKEQPIVQSSRDAYNLIAPIIADNSFEEFWILLLNRGSKLIKKIKISSGGVNAVLADPRLIFKHAIENLASVIILVHNHPSGNLQPSREDLNITKKLQQGAKLLDLSVPDHLIITQDGYFSFADEGLI